jgi:hypothetical protein
MDRVAVDGFLHSLRASLAANSSRFPLDASVQSVSGQHGDRQRMTGQGSPLSEGLVRLLMLLDATSVSASLAIKNLGRSGDDSSGIRDALVDLWGRSEAARCLLIDSQGVFSGAEATNRVHDLWETARLLAPDAIAIAMRLSEPVEHYVEFATKVVSQAPSKAEPS